MWMAHKKQNYLYPEGHAVKKEDSMKTSTVGSGMDFFLDRIDEGRRDFFSMNTAANKLPEGLFPAQQGTVLWVVFYFFEHFSFGVGSEFVVKQKVHPGDKILTVLNVFHCSSRLRFLLLRLPPTTNTLLRNTL